MNKYLCEILISDSDIQSYLQFDASKFEEEQEAILCSNYENQPQVSIMSPPSSPR